MSKSRKRAEPSDRMLEYRLRCQKVDAWQGFGGLVVRWGGAVAIALFLYLTCDALAGKATTASIGLSLLGDLKISTALAWLFGVGGGAYGLGQRKLRRDTIERLQGRIQDLERELDPKRSTSGLTPRGDTQPGDER